MDFYEFFFYFSNFLASFRHSPKTPTAHPRTLRVTPVCNGTLIENLCSIAIVACICNPPQSSLRYS
jgi:hypothetical protein